MNYEYFYGKDDAEQYAFYRIPKRLITGEEFQDDSTEAKLLYGLMLDRLQLSIKTSGWTSRASYTSFTPSKILCRICTAAIRKRSRCSPSWRRRSA